MPGSWINSLFDCCTPMNICCEAYWCPCILFGKTAARVEDPTLAGYSCCNGSCMGFAALGCLGVQAILQCAHRGNIRSKYDIEGDNCTDCLVAWCCCCCGLMQSEKETIDRSAQMTQQQGYQPQQKMDYQPQQQLQQQAQQPQQYQAQPNLAYQQHS